MDEIAFSDGTGVLQRYKLASPHLSVPRTVDVWCPPGYAADPTTRYPVIYMHDGQNLFDPGLVNSGVDWGIDEAITGLSEAQGLSGAIVVGIWNSSQRWRDYMPQRPLAAPAGADLLAKFAEAAGGPPQSDSYLGFLVEELKPLIDATYRTLPGQPHTFVMGSSMGGLISLYALSQYPDCFGGAGCLSSHWSFGGDELVDWMGANLPSAGRHRLYFDYGSLGLDAAYAPFQQRMDRLVEAAGYRQGRDWLTRSFPGTDHHERDWRARVQIPLAFLLG